MPKYAQPAILQFTRMIGFYGLVDAQILMVSRKDFDRLSLRVIEQNEIFKQIEEILLSADAAQHGFQRNTADLILFETLPLMEKRIFTAQRADFGVYAVAQHHKSVVIEELRDGIQIILIVIRIGILYIDVVLFQLDKQQRKTVDETHDIRPPMMQRAVDVQLLNRQKVVFLRMLEVDDRRKARFLSAARFFDRHRNTVADEPIFLLVDFHRRRGGKAAFQTFLRFIHLRSRHPRVQLLQRRTEIAGQNDFLVAFASEGAEPMIGGDIERFRMKGIGGLPAQLVFQAVDGAFLDEDGFGIGGGHGINLLTEFE